MVTRLCIPTLHSLSRSAHPHMLEDTSAVPGRKKVLCIMSCQEEEPELIGLHMVLCMCFIPLFSRSATPSLSSASEEPRGKHGCCQTMSEATHSDAAVGHLCSDLLVAI